MSAKPDIRLVPLTRESGAHVQELLERAADYFRALADTDVPANMAERLFQEVNTTPNRHVMGILQGEELIGVLDFRLRYPAPDAAQLGLILLRPDMRGQGKGSLVMDIWETWLDVQTPIERVRAAVPAHMRQAQRFFFKRGYHLTGESYRLVVGESRPRVLIMEKLLRLKSLEEDTEEGV